MKKITGLLILLMALVACNSKKAGEPPISFLADGGLFVLNQGNFTYGAPHFVSRRWWFVCA